MSHTPHDPIINCKTPIADCDLFIFDFDNTLYDGHHFAIRLVFANLLHALRCKAERKVRKLLAGKDLLTADALRTQLTTLLAHHAHYTSQSQVVV